MRPGFMLAFMGTAVASIALVISALGSARTQPLTSWSAPLYLAVIVLTGTFHVPRNNALAEVDRESEEAGPAWMLYLSQWTAGNHLRVVLCVVSMVAFTLSLLAG